MANGNDVIENQKKLTVPSSSGFTISPVTRRTPKLGDSSTVETDHAIVLNSHQTNRSIQFDRPPLLQVSFENSAPTSEITCRIKSSSDRLHSSAENVFCGQKWFYSQIGQDRIF